jgi:hypothetical protein
MVHLFRTVSLIFKRVNGESRLIDPICHRSHDIVIVK